jgi:hypothetical protein
MAGEQTADEFAMGGFCGRHKASLSDGFLSHRRTDEPHRNKGFYALKIALNEIDIPISNI